jgi:hypothetical protein
MSLRSAGSVRRRSLWPLRLGLVLLAGATASAAVADTVIVRDPRNARANKFDIRSARATHRHALLRHTIRTFASWRSSELVTTEKLPRDLCVYVWRAKSDPKEQQDYQICSYYKKGKLRGSVFHVRPPRKRTGKLTVQRFDSKSISYTFSKEAIGNPRAYQWQAIAGYTGKGCPKDPPFQFGCDDSAPTRSVKVHELVPAQAKP